MKTSELIDELKLLLKDNKTIDNNTLSNLVGELSTLKTRYELLLDATVIGYWDYDFEKNEVYISDSLRTIMNSKSNVLNFEELSIDLSIHPDDKPLRDEVLNRAISLGSDYQMEYRLKILDGNYRYYLSKGKVIHDKNGKPIRLVGTLQDIEEQKRKEIKLKIQDYVIENTLTPVVWVNENAEIVSFNKALEKLWGYSNYELDKLTMADIDPNFTTENWKSHWNNIKNQGSLKSKIHNKTKNGNILEIDFTANFVNIDNQELNFVFLNDVTVRNKTLRDLKLYSYVINNTLTPVAWIDKKGKIYKTNKAYLDLLGYTEEELLELNILAIDGEDYGKMWDAHWNDLKTNKTLNFVTKNIRKDGKSIDIRVTANYVELDGLELNCAFVYDITEQLAFEKKLAENERILNTLIENIPLAIQFLDKEGALFRYNKGFEKLYGIEPNSNHGLGINVLTHPMMKELDVYPFYKEVYEKKKLVTFENLIDLKGTAKYDYKNSRAKLYIKNTTFPILNQDGEIEFVASFMENVTNERVAESIKNETLSKYTNLINNINGIVWEADPNTTQFTYVSNQAIDMLGYPLNEWLDTPTFWIDHIYEADRDASVRFCELSTSNLQDHTFEYRMVKKDGSLIWIKDIVKVESENGKPTKLSGLLIDITDKKQAEFELIESKNRLSAVIESTKDIVFALDKDLNYLLFNQNHFNATNALYGTSPKIGHNMLDFIGNNKDNQYIVNGLKRALKGEYVVVEQIFGNENGPKVYLEAIANPIFNENREITGVAVFVKDITKNKLIEESLKESEARFRKLFNEIPHVAVQGYRRDGTIFFWNKASENYYGYSNEEALGQNIHKLLNADENAANESQRIAELMFDTKNPLPSDQLILNKKNGEEIRVIGSNAYVELPDGSGEMFCVDVDITELINIQEKVEKLLDELIEKNDLIEVNLQQKIGLLDELQTLNDKLTSSIKEKDKYFSILAHDLRSPLSAFMSLSRELSENIEDLSKEQISEFARTMKESSENVYDLLENLLKWSQFQRGIIEFTPENTFFNFIIDSNINIIKPKANLKQIEVINNINTNFTLFADVKMVNLILRNLLSNAVKFTPTGGKIEIGLINNQNDKFTEYYNLYDNVIIFYIKDNGIGMPDYIKNNIFKLDSNVSRQGTENEPSTGLGLVLCKEFVDIHKGKIWVETEENKGTTFYIGIPQSY